MKAKYKAIIFDWDGTLADSTSRIVEGVQFAFQTATIPVPSESAIKQIIGLGLNEAMQILYPPADEQLNQQLVQYYRQHNFRPDNITRLFADVTQLLPLLNQQFVLTVATGKSRAGLDRSLADTATQSLFYATRTVNECASKPAPQMILSLLDELGMDKEEVVMVGDTTHDLQMALNAGVDAFGLETGAHSLATLKTVENKGIFPTFTDFYKHLLA